MGIQAVKGVEIGDGFALARLRGSAAHDEIVRGDAGLHRETNRAGGIEGGMSNGEEIVVRAAMKPLPTLMQPLASVDLQTGEPAQALVERSDVSAVEALAVVAEAAVAWELARAAREKFGGDALGDFVAAWRAYVERIDWQSATNRSDTGSCPHVALDRLHGGRLKSVTTASCLTPGGRGATPLPARRARRVHGRGQVDARGRGRARIGAVLDLDDEIERRTGSTVVELFREPARPASGASRKRSSREALERLEPYVVALGGGAVLSERTRRTLAERATTVVVPIDVDAAVGARARLRSPARAGRGRVPPRSTRSGARSYEQVADAVAHDADDVVLAAAGVLVERGALQRLGELVPGDGAVALVSDENVAGIHGMDAQLALGARLAQVHELPPGEEAKTIGALDRLWQDLRLDRSGTVVALGGGCTTDAAGLRSSDVPARHRLGARADEPRRAGRRGDRRQDRDRPAAGQEPRRRLPLARAHGDRSRAARDAARRRSGSRAWRRS